MKSGVIQASVKSGRGDGTISKRIGGGGGGSEAEDSYKEEEEKGILPDDVKEKEDHGNDDDVFCWSDRAEKVRGQCVLILKWNCH